MPARQTKKKTRKQRPSDEGSAGYERIETTKLLLDPNNPRLAEYLPRDRRSQEDVLRVLWREMAVDELALSIAASGYFDYEPLFVVEKGGNFVVIEGNRRLAAVMLLLDSQKRKEFRATEVPSISPAAKNSLRELPVIRTTRREAWQYLGFKHVNGPAKWDSFAKAQYIAQIHNEYKVPLDDIGKQIGDRHKTVQRLYRAFMVLEQAEAAKVFARDNRYRQHFSFSHLYTGLDYDGISGFIELRDEEAESPTPVPDEALDRLGELFTWLYGDKGVDMAPVVQSQNPHLRQLSEVLNSRKATETLRAGLPLTVALEASYGDERVFRN